MFRLIGKYGFAQLTAIVDESQGNGYQTGHMWLAVPPFDVVDMTLSGRSIERELAMVKVRGAGDNRVWSETGCTCVLVTSTRDVLR